MFAADPDRFFDVVGEVIETVGLDESPFWGQVRGQTQGESIDARHVEFMGT
ncbi:hypothetical protein [Streptomyces sp. NBC_01506]|uniref:hypothetical protein n=1 Tax=Streptomyces sp. NBC_01506 TaxID=2903887 RepID=UPI00386B6279